MKRSAVGVLLVLASLATPSARAVPPGGSGDATVIAVIDSGISPYHWDFLASKMPQAQNADPSDDLPLDQPPDTWLPGFPSPGEFAGYRPLDLTLDGVNADTPIAMLETLDKPTWDAVQTSVTGAVNFYWIPRTKVIGALSFGGGKIKGTTGTHGMGTTSVSVGNIHGTCPECLLVFIQYGGVASGEAAIEWAMSQPWIDAITNSYGFSLVERDRFYSGSNTVAQRLASERGQTIFFSAGNGYLSAFIVPNTTLFSSQEGPDWIVTVGAISPTNGTAYSGAGKPVDVAGVGSSYPSAIGATEVGGDGRSFSGTSNATPTVAGMYARALYGARRDLSGLSRTQSGGVVATGDPFACGPARPACELSDGVLTASELRARLFEGAVHTPTGQNLGGTGSIRAIGEDEFVDEGYGSYYARAHRASVGDEEWLSEFDRIFKPLEGAALPPARPNGEREWMVVDSFCRQHLWGAWSDGAYLEGVTPLPGPNPLFPLRSGIEAACPYLFPPV